MRFLDAIAECGNIKRSAFAVGMGMLVGYTQEYSDSLLIALLKAHLPEKYRERVEQSETVRHESERPC